MEAYILNPNFEAVHVCDYFSSLIWTKRYNKTGDFELYVPVNKDNIFYFMPGTYITKSLDKQEIAVITSIQLETDEENGDYITAKGLFIDSILNRRIVWSQTNLDGKVTECIYKLLDDNVMNPVLQERKIPLFTVGGMCRCEITMKKQITGDNLLDAIQEIMYTYKLGYKVLYKNGTFRFEMYEGVNRSMNQSENVPIVFSYDNDNLTASSYTADETEYKNVAIIAGEGEGVERRTSMVGTASGMERREMFVDARNISSDVDGGKLTDEQYDSMLKQQGNDKLSEKVKKESFEGTIEPETNYVFGKDYNIGDIVQVINEYGISAPTRITEVIECWDENGHTCIPTFDSEEV